jgi:DNA invertase Pin-like site-specific DNA recombinase
MSINACYVRCSSLDSHPETQLMALKEFSQRHGNTITMEFVDHGQSGIKREREQLNNMLEAARKGKFSTLYVVGIDRLSRSVKDLIEVVESLNQMGIQIHFMRENIDTRTATGSFFLTVLGSLYQLERSVMIDRINQGIARAKSQGKHCGRPSKINSSLIASVKLLREKGVSIRDISKTCSLGVGTVMKVIQENQISLNIA